MDQSEFEAAVEKLTAAITDETGGPRPISRIEFEIIGRQVRWSLWEGSQRLHTLTGLANDIHGFLSASKLIMEMRAEGAARA
jgi:hypothetical protein